MSVFIRPAQIADADAISRLVMALAPDFLDSPETPELAPFVVSLMPAATTERLESEQFRYFLAEDVAGLCGVVALRDDSHLYHLFVRADAQGRGIARALWEHARVQSASHTFTVNASMRAVTVYQRLGFVASDAAQRLNGLAYVPMQLVHRS